MSDYISREAAYETLREYYHLRTEIQHFSLQDALGRVPAADVKPVRWIPVEEQLPENGVNVLCWYEYYHWSAERVLPEYGIGYCINGMWGAKCQKDTTVKCCTGCRCRNRRNKRRNNA